MDKFARYLFANFSNNVAPGEKSESFEVYDMKNSYIFVNVIGWSYATHSDLKWTTNGCNIMRPSDRKTKINS